MSVTVAADDEPATPAVVPSSITSLTQNIPCIIRSTRIVNDVITPTIYTVGNFSYVGTFTTAGMGTSSDDQLLLSYRSMSSGYVNLYEYSFPSDIVASYADTFTITLDLNYAFDDLKYIYSFWGLAYTTTPDNVMTVDSYPDNFLSASSANPDYNGHIPAFTFGTNHNIYGRFYWTFPGSIFGSSNPQFLNFIYQRLYYNDASAPLSVRCNSITFNVNYNAYVLGGKNHFYFAMGGPVVSQDGTVGAAPETIEDILAVTEEQKQLLINISLALEDTNGGSLISQILAVLNSLLSALNTGVLYDIDLTLHRIELAMPSGGGGSGGITGSQFIDLFTLDDEDLTDIGHDWNAMFNTYFPAFADVRDTFTDSYDDLTSGTYEARSSISLPSFAVEGNTVIPSLELPLKPQGFNDFFDLLKIIINCVVTFAFLNGLRHRFDKTVLEDEG